MGLRSAIRNASRGIYRMASTTPNYDAASRSVRTMGWNPGSDAINALISSAGDELRRKSRDMARKNPYAINAIEAFVGNVVGTGIKPIPLHPDTNVKRNLKQLWTDWTDDADAAGLTDFYGLQALACRTVIEAGECLVRIRPRFIEDGLAVPMQLQMLEPEHLPLTLNQTTATANVIRWGIEFDPIGRRAAYHLYREHPGERNLFFSAPNETRRVPANEVVHLYKPKRPGQQRGEAWLTPVLVTLHELEKYDGAELIRKSLAAMMAFFIEDQDPGNPLFGKDETDQDGIPVQGIEPGSVTSVPPGKKITFNEPVDVGGMYEQFMRVQLRKVAAGLGITYEMISGDMTGVNYSSARVALLEFRRRIEAFQHQVMVFQFCRPIWRAFVEAAVLAGKIQASDYRRNQMDYLRVQWRPAAWEWIDPVQDIKAEVMAIDNLLKSRSATIAETGYDLEEVDQQILESQESERENGLVRRDAAASLAVGRQAPETPIETPTAEAGR